MRKPFIVVVIPHSHSWLWTQVCVASLKRNPPVAAGCDVRVIVVDNSPWSPSIKGITDTALGDGVEVLPNHKSNRFHASALDCVVEKVHFDYLMALETDVMLLRPTWLQWFMDQLGPDDYAIGAWHHEQYVNPSCTLYHGAVLRNMARWCRASKEPELLRWGPDFSLTQPLDQNTCEPSVVADYVSWVAGPFAEKRGFPHGTECKETPSGQLKGPGWWEPGQQLHHWATNNGCGYTVCQSLTTHVNNVPVQTLYGSTMPDPQRQLEAVELFGNAEAAHLWGGTRALDILKHDVTCQFVKANTPIWLAREARFWRQTVPEDVQRQTLELIREHGWHTTGQGNNVKGGDARDRVAVEYVRACYREGGVEW